MKKEENRLETLRIKEDDDKLAIEVVRNRQVANINKSFYSKRFVKIINKTYE